MTAVEALNWAAAVEMLIKLGVTSFAVITAAMRDAGVAEDDAAIAALQTKWDLLVADVARAAHPNP